MTTPLFVFRSAELLILPAGAAATPASPAPPDPAALHDFGDCRVVDWPADLALPAGAEARGLRGLHGVLAAEAFALAGKAYQLLGWARTHRFCGTCGGPTAPDPRELARACAACGAVVYPRLNPAVIVLVTRGDEALLSRSPHFAPGVYSCQAGFVGPGESLEEAVRREVREEVGVELGEVRYFGSQPWPFPNSLMIGFRAEWVQGEIVRDPSEIEDARWWRRDALPGLPGHLSIARALIDGWA